jgi:glycosyltransferase involved in cell wall biosynthesis
MSADITAGQRNGAHRVLMICYLFPPLRSSGTARSVGFAQNLPKFGWVPTVLTVRNAKDAWSSAREPVPVDVEIVRTGEWNLDGLVEFANGALNRCLHSVAIDLKRNYFRQLVVPDTHIAWFSTAAGVRLARRADIVYASCSPFSSAISGCLIKMLTGRPLVVDFRDPWSLNPYNRTILPHRAAVAFFERFVVSMADRLIVNTEGAERLYKNAYPAHANRILSIANGFDWLPPSPARSGPKGLFRIVHVGAFYGSRSPDNLLEALARLDDDRVEFVQVGNRVPAFERFADRVRIRVIRTVPRERALELMCEASLLYLRQGDEPGVRDYVSVGAKTYEYLATGIPVLAECPEGDNAELVRRFSQCSFVVKPGDVPHLVGAVRAALEREGSPPTVDPEFVGAFDRTRLTGQLAAAFDSVLLERHYGNAAPRPVAPGS